MVSKFFATAAVAAIAASAFLARPALAGFTATTAGVTVNNTAQNAGYATVGDTFNINDGTFLSYLPDGPQDPQITGADLPNFGYTINATISNIAGNVVTYNGTYRIFYNLNNNDTYESGTDASVSAGNTAITATFDPLTGTTATLVGTLTQTQGPTGPGAGNFADLAARYNNNPVDLTGTYLGAGGATGTLVDGIIRQSAPATPLPSSAAMGLGVLGLAGAAAFLRRKPKTV